MNTANIIFLNKNNRKVKIIIVIKNSLRAERLICVFIPSFYGCFMSVSQRLLNAPNTLQRLMCEKNGLCIAEV